MSSTDPVKAEAHQNEYLPEGGSVVDAIVTVTMEGEPGAGVPADGRAAEIILIDCSSSMAGANMAAAKEAAGLAIDTLRDGVRFAIVAGTHYAEAVYPLGRRLVPASAQTRDQAKAAVRRLSASGGTAIGTWLRLANELFIADGTELNHAILLTDGANGEREGELARALAECAGRFVCDSRGVGRGWVAKDLIMIAEALLGTAAGIKDPAGLTADFQAMTEAAMGKTMADVSLRVWTPVDAKVRFVKQMFPAINDLTARRTDVSARVGEYPMGSWGAESRDYHVSIEVPPNPVGEELLAARVSVVHGADVLAQCLVRAVWTDDLGYSTRINKRVAHYGGQTELAEAIQEGLAARAAGDVETATSRLGTAVRLAAESGREDTAKVLAGVVDVVDAETGTVRLKKQVDNVDLEIATLDSQKTNRVRPT